MSKFNHSEALKSEAYELLSQAHENLIACSEAFAQQDFEECAEFWRKQADILFKRIAWYSSKAQKLDAEAQALKSKLAKIEQEKKAIESAKK